MLTTADRSGSTTGAKPSVSEPTVGPGLLSSARRSVTAFVAPSTERPPEATVHAIAPADQESNGHGDHRDGTPNLKNLITHFMAPPAN